MIIRPAPEEKKNKDFKNKQNLIDKVGTKLGNLIFFLKNTDKHAIIFSQWDDLLRKVGDVLDDYGIKNVFCKGNVWQRGKAIKEFNSDKDVKVIMLSSESAASGTNLTKAELVILLDPVHGTYEYRTNTERQAIGRAYRMGQTKQVEVVRFIVRNTIEEDIYKLNKEDDQKSNVNMKIFEFDDANINLDEDKIEEIAEAVKNAEKKKTEKPPKKIASKVRSPEKIREEIRAKLKKIQDDMEYNIF
jgi:SWI/SNF-related matrix-associated actin-dependent regulator 1 of chromatin subfamily A